jgi:hypothetical protein
MNNMNFINYLHEQNELHELQELYELQELLIIATKLQKFFDLASSSEEK